MPTLPPILHLIPYLPLRQRSQRHAPWPCFPLRQPSEPDHRPPLQQITFSLHTEGGGGRRGRRGDEGGRRRGPTRRRREGPLWQDPHVLRLVKGRLWVRNVLFHTSSSSSSSSSSCFSCLPVSTTNTYRRIVTRTAHQRSQSRLLFGLLLYSFV
ncbi:hypothetical protein E2C01_086929 [Portunus trituberculatus]|uniref:Uncharacterized protein n=1 Tax=Portunus trituberculatus TaxID=210409 RepID=A0A5B7JFY9_PORTR|nr:hypothetical protein [Portunus trituberculatus]